MTIQEPSPSDYIVYVDESGDHGLQSINQNYPIFVLTFCCFKKDHYINKVVPKIQDFKFKYFGHDQVVLHEHPIRKQKEEFSFLRSDSQLRNNFLSDLNLIMNESCFDIFPVIINKRALTERYKKPFNPYDIALLFGLERLYTYLSRQEQNTEVHLVFEKRGKKEDDELELEFRRIIAEPGKFNNIKFNIVFADKKTNSSGLQFADLTSRPIGINHLNESQPNRAYEIIQAKIRLKKVFP